VRVIVERIARVLAIMRSADASAAEPEWRHLCGEALAILDTLAACPSARRWCADGRAALPAANDR
jgi:hypothetical protein